MQAEVRTFRLTSALDRYSMPAVIAVTIVFGTAFALENAPRTPSLAFLLPIPVAALAILWLGLTSPRYGDLTVSSTEIRVVGLFGLVSVIERSGVAKIVKATIIYPARYGTDPTKKVLLVGQDGRCHILLNNSYEVSALAGAIGVPVENVRTPMRPSAVNKRYPGTVNGVSRFGPVGIALVVIVGVIIVIGLYHRIIRH